MSDFSLGKIDWERGAFAPAINTTPSAQMDSYPQREVSNTRDIGMVGEQLGFRVIYIATDGGVFESVPTVKPKPGQWLNFPA